MLLAAIAQPPAKRTIVSRRRFQLAGAWSLPPCCRSRREAEILSHWYVSELPFYRYRHVVKPGISGWAQVNKGHVAGVGEVSREPQYDFYYIKYFSPWLDILILVRTIKTMLPGIGSR